MLLAHAGQSVLARICIIVLGVVVKNIDDGTDY